MPGTRVYRWAVFDNFKFLGIVYAEDEDHAVAVALQTYGHIEELSLHKMV
jgi:hypothetical protein